MSRTGESDGGAAIAGAGTSLFTAGMMVSAGVLTPVVFGFIVFANAWGAAGGPMSPAWSRFTTILSVIAVFIVLAYLFLSRRREQPPGHEGADARPQTAAAGIHVPSETGPVSREAFEAYQDWKDENLEPALEERVGPADGRR